MEDGEIIYNAKESTAKVVPGNQKGDKNLSMLKPEDAVITNKFGLSAKGRQAAKALESLSTTKKNRGLLGK
ncbi:hypothetical protein [Sharpea azabuensis]|uniref:hypothetical protein n=1 Tax=Sharpea azabuensis TaxID=322505 RepID=UPI00156A6A3E|nr:hypothetical protein [Sharpea azabuensis]